MNDSFDEFSNPLAIPQEYLPNHVIYPICWCCRCVIADWPHYAEKMEGEYLCTECSKDA
jgi:hypothetical protein